LQQDEGRLEIAVAEVAYPLPQRASRRSVQRRICVEVHVVVLVQRGGPRVIEAGAGIDQATLRSLFQRYVPLSSRICSDSAGCYRLLEAIGYQVEQVNHGAGEYARGDVHENTAECEIGLLQQFLLAHRGISMATLPSYLKLHQFRRNERERPYREQACLLLASLLGQGPGPRCLLPAPWAHGRDECRVWRPPREQVEAVAAELAA
jgi:transposase-like protein